MINAFILEGELTGMNEDSINLRIDDDVVVNIKMRPSMVEILSEAETSSPFIAIQGRFIQDKDKSIELFAEKVTLAAPVKEQAIKRKHNEYSR